MKNEHENENFVPEIDPAVNLASQETASPASSVAVAVQAAAQRHNLGQEAQERITQLLQSVSADSFPDDVVDMLALALRRDDDVSNAEATGYVRGRNENIDITLNNSGHDDDDDSTLHEVNFPRYVKRSIWD